jgi:septation ring formation regulator EzrA
MTMDPLKAAQAVADTGNMGLMVVILAIALSIIAGMSMLVFWMWKKGSKTKESQDAKDKAQLDKVLEAVADGTRRINEKLEPLLAKIEVLFEWKGMVVHDREIVEERLKNGNKSFETLRTDVQELKDRSTLRLAELVDKPSFEDYCKEHKIEHDQLNRDIRGIRDAQGDLKVSFAALGSEIKAAVGTVSGIMSRVVTVGEREKPDR